MPFYMNDDFPKRKTILAAGRELSRLTKAYWRSPTMYRYICSKILEYSHISPISKVLAKILPHNHWGDRIFNRWKFKEREGRFPRLSPPQE